MMALLLLTGVFHAVRIGKRRNVHSLEATAETTAALFVNCNQNNRLVYLVGLDQSGQSVARTGVSVH